MQETRSTVCDVVGYEGAYFSLNHSVLIINVWPLFYMKMDKKLSASWGLRPPEPPPEAPPLDPRYRLALRARHAMTPHLQTPSAVHNASIQLLIESAQRIL